MAAFFFPHIIFRCAMACSWQQRELTAQSARSFIFVKEAALCFRWVFRNLVAIATTSAFHMHVFGGAAAEREELSGLKCISLCLSYNFPFPSCLSFFSTTAHSLLPRLPSLLLSSLSSSTHLFSGPALWDLTLSCVKPQISTSSKTGQSPCRPAARPHSSVGLTGWIAKCVPLQYTLCVSERVLVIYRMEGWV